MIKQQDLLFELYTESGLFGNANFSVRVIYVPTRDSVVASGGSEQAARYNALLKLMQFLGDEIESCACCGEERLDAVLGEPCSCAYELCPGVCYELGLR